MRTCKTPLFPFHIWLGEAHSTAPLAGSILLAAVILKLATYGYLRVLLPMFPDATNYFSPLVQTIAVITLVYASLATIRQVDTKKIVAYSSIGHQAVVVRRIILVGEFLSLIGIMGVFYLLTAACSTLTGIH
jgi:NADH-ubiquinone oxidoreductase chain 4